MERVLQCDCGFKARAVDEEELVTEVQRHAWEAHCMALPHDEALLLTSRAELVEKEPSRIPAREPDHDPSQDAMFDREEEE